MKKILVLVVDDDQSMVDFLVACLKTRNYEVEVAYSGQQGCEKARMLKPELVILDLIMPGMHGFDVCQSLRQNEGLRNTKILISSSKKYPTDQRAVKRLGADGFIAKPYTADQLLESVRDLVGSPGHS